MKTFPIKNPLKGEQVVDIHPALRAFTGPYWRRRLNNFTGRALTHTALRTEQDERAGLLATLGQMVSPGVFTGLEVDQGKLDTGESETAVIQVSPGTGISAEGEIVTLTRSVKVVAKDIHVYAPISVLDEEGGGSTGDEEEGTPVPGALLSRRLGPSLRDLINNGASLPPAAILVLQPVVAEINAAYDSSDPCELDPENYAFENWQLIDGCRLVLYSWPVEYIPLPPADEWWRNRLAHCIFSLEKQNGPDDVLPWEAVGVPIALIGFDDAWDPLFIDRNAVKRSGGKRPLTETVLKNMGNRFLRQARFEQFNEHLAELVMSEKEGENIVVKASEEFRYLPPVGVLPNNFMVPREGTQVFFPLSYDIDAVAIPYEQLDVVVRDSALSDAFDINLPDRVQVLVPVPQVYYEPDLLKKEEIDPEFDLTIQEFTDQRNSWLGRRLDVRRKASSIQAAIKNEAITFPEPDPGAVDNLELPEPYEYALVEAGDSWRYFKGTAEPPENWATAEFNDNTWLSGKTGIGYEAGGNETKLDDMQGNYATFYCRKPFKSSESDNIKHYKLIVITNGGFYAYVNGGIEVASHNVTGKAHSAAALSRADAVPIEIDLGTLEGSLHEDGNILAFQVHNYDMNSASFTFVPRLIEKEFVADVGEEDFSTDIKKGDGEVPELNEQHEPLYEVGPLEELRKDLADSPLSDDELAVLDGQGQNQDEQEQDRRGVEDFIRYLQEKVDKADDMVDYYFLKVRTDTYKVRQLMLGNVEGTKLATSPILAEIAKGQTAAATRKDITAFMARLKEAEGKKIGHGGVPGVGGGAGKTAAFSGSSRISGINAGLSEELKKTAFFETVDARAKESKVLPGKKGTEEIGFELFKDKESDRSFVAEQSAVVGFIHQFHNVTVAERLQDPIAVGAKISSVATKTEIIDHFLNAEINVSGLVVPGFQKGSMTGEKLKKFQTVRGNELTVKYQDIDEDDIKDLALGKHDVNPKNKDGSLQEDEGAFFNAAIRALENAGSILRLVEGRIHDYRIAIDQCKKVLDELYKQLNLADIRLKVIGDELAESRHDVSVARLIKAEELERIQSVNERRDTIIEEQVPFLVFRRPRLFEARVNAPVHALNPDLSDAPLPVCDVDEEETPEEISAMMDVMREAPLKWFTMSKKILGRLNRLNDLRITLKSAKSRARAKTTRHPLLDIKYETLSLLGQGIGKTLYASQKAVLLQRRKTSAIDIAALNRFGWNETASYATDVLSLGDVIDGNHGRAGAGREASRELDRISRIATCIYLRFGHILPSIRLDWAERLSQFDAPIKLINLNSLPRWGEVEYIERNEIQSLVDWLYQRVDASESEAVDLISDLIRICILMASHAPVNKIIAGHIPEPATVRPGSTINIVASLSRVRIGMNVMMQSGGKTVATGTVRDIVGGRVTAHVLKTMTKTVLLEKNAIAQIGEPRSIGKKQFSFIR